MPQNRGETFTLKVETMEKEKFTLTIQAVKNCIAFEPETPIFKTLNSACDLWYEHAKKQGASDEEAANYAFERLGETMLKISETTGG